MKLEVEHLALCGAHDLTAGRLSRRQFKKTPALVGVAALKLGHHRAGLGNTLLAETAR